MSSADPDPLQFALPRALPPGQRLVDSLPVHHYGRVPKIDLASWALTVSGETADGGVTRLSWDDVCGLPVVEEVADLHCASRVSAQDIRWGGIPCRAVVDLVPPAPGARHIIASGAYGYSTSITVDDLLSPRALFATHLDGEPLTPEHGWPLRLVLPHLYGWKGPKWLLEIEYSSTVRRGFWEEKGYHVVGDAWREERYSYRE